MIMDAAPPSSRIASRSRALLRGGLPPIFVVAMAMFLLRPALLAAGLPGLPPHRGGGFLLMRVHQMSSALLSFHVPPRWMPDAAHGLGDPLWIYHGPLSYMLPALVALLGGGFVGAIKVTWLLLVPAAALGAFSLGRGQWGSAAAGLVCAAAYLAAPGLLVSLYARPDALPELAGMALLPWLLVLADRSIERASSGRLGLLALGYAALLTADPVAGLVFPPLLLAWRTWGRGGSHGGLRARARGIGHSGEWESDAGQEPEPEPEPEPAPEPRLPAVEAVAFETESGSGSGVREKGAAVGSAAGPGQMRRVESWGDRLELQIWRLRPEGRLGRALPVGLALLLGFALALWFVAPAVLERDQVRPGGASVDAEAPLFEGLDVIDRDLSYSLGWANDPALPSRSGLVPSLAALVGLALALVSRDRRRRRLALAWGLLALLPILLSHALARPLWAELPRWPGGWQPWRLLQAQALALAMLAGPIGLPLPSTRSRDDRPEASYRQDRGEGAAGTDPRLPVWAVAVLVSLGFIHVAGGAAGAGSVLGVHDVHRSDLAAFETLSGTSGAWGEAGHLPVSANRAPISGVDTVLGHEGSPRAVPGFGLLDGATWTHREAALQDWQIRVASGQPTTLAFPTYWFPGWSYSVDGAPTKAAAPLEGSGWVEVLLTPENCRSGDCSVSLVFARSDVRALAEGISLLALLIVLLLLLRAPRLRIGRFFVAALVALPLLVIAARAMPRGAETGLRVVDASADLPHLRPEGIRFGAARLDDASVRLATSDGIGAEADDGPLVALDAGDRLEVELFFTDAPADLRVALALVTPVERSRGIPDVWATSEAAITDEAPLSLEVPDALSSGLYLLRLDLFDADGAPLPARDAEGREIGPLYLGPLRVRGRPDLLSREEGMVAVMGDITLQQVETEVRGTPEGIWLMVDLTWRCDRAPVLDYVSSVRLLDARGDTLLRSDEMPGYGLHPTTAWRDGERIVERRWLRLDQEDPEDLIDRLDAAETYIIEVALYDGLSEEELGSGRLLDVSIER